MRVLMGMALGTAMALVLASTEPVHAQDCPSLTENAPDDFAEGAAEPRWLTANARRLRGIMMHEWAIAECEAGRRPVCKTDAVPWAELRDEIPGDWWDASVERHRELRAALEEQASAAQDAEIEACLPGR